MTKKLEEIINGIEENDEGYLEYWGEASSPHYHKWSDGHQERLEKEILKHYTPNDQVQKKVEDGVREFVDLLNKYFYTGNERSHFDRWFERYKRGEK